MLAAKEQAWLSHSSHDIFFCSGEHDYNFESL